MGRYYSHYMAKFSACTFEATVLFTTPASVLPELLF